MRLTVAPQKGFEIIRRQILSGHKCELTLDGAPHGHPALYTSLSGEHWKDDKPVNQQEKVHQKRMDDLCKQAWRGRG